ncbi:MAG: hypothetical protein CSA86_04920 [Arcobacter sp.]|nr:MAG: hypothetical protein CSA86_04920 [Arcobacter sp.]
MLKKSMLVLPLLSALIFFTACSEKKKEEVKVKKEVKKIEVKVHTLNKQTYPIWLDFTGKTQALENVFVTSRISGELEKIYFKAGQKVKKGDVLFKIDDSEYKTIVDQKQASVNKAKSNLNLALSKLKRYEPLVQQGLAPREKLDELKASVQQYKSLLNADKSALKDAKINVNYSQVKANIKGTIGKALVDIGNIVNKNDKLANIVQTKELYVNFNPSSNAVFLINQYKSEKYPKVKVLPENIEDEKLSLKGRIDFIDNMTDKSTGTVSMRAKIDNSKDLLFPGTFVKIKLFITDKVPILALNPNNIYQNQLGSYVLIVNKENKVQKVQVEVSYSNKDLAIIKSGLKQGDRVIVSEVSQLRDNQEVIAKEVANSITIK